MTLKLLLFVLFLSSQFLAICQLKKVEVNGIEIHYKDTGRGEPVVFVHGVLEDYRTWEAQIKNFAKKYRVISYSRRYNYPNDNPTLLKNFSAQTEATDLYKFVKELNLERFHLIGHSFGGLTSLFFAKNHPNLLLSLTLSEPALLGWIPKNGKLYKDFYEGMLKQVKRGFKSRDTTAILRNTLIYFADADILDKFPTEAVEALKQNLLEWKAVAYSSEAFPNVPKQFLTTLKMPVILVFAEKTLPILQVVNKELVKLLPKAKKYTLKDGTHDLWMTHPNEVGKAVFNYFQANKRN